MGNKPSMNALADRVVASQSRPTHSWPAAWARVPGRLAVVLAALLSLVAVVPIMSARAGGAPTETGDLKAEVRGLIDELGGDTRARRSAAEQRLLEIGPVVLDLLPPPELLSSISVRSAVDRIRVELERRKARESLRASEITLSGRHTLGQCLEEIQRQTGNALDLSELRPTLRDQPLDVSWNTRPFWPALDDLTQLAPVKYAFDAARRSLIFRPRMAVAPPREGLLAGSGPFRFNAAPAEVRPLAGAAPADNAEVPAASLIRVVLSVQAEPRLRPLFAEYAAAEITATLPSGVVLAPFSPDARYEVPVGNGGAPTTLQLDYVLPQNAAGARLDLAGKMRMTVAADSAAIRFADVVAEAHGKDLRIARRRGGVTVTLQRVRRERMPGGKTELRVQVLVAYDSGGPAFESHRSWALHNEAYLEDKTGVRVALNGGYEMTLQADGAIGMEYRFVELPDPPPDYAFVYVAPTLIVDAPIEFALKAVPVRQAK